MLVDKDIYKKTYKGNGDTTVFPIQFPFLENEHVQVVRSADNGATESIVPASEYTITGAGVEAGGTCTFKVAPPSGTTIVVTRNVPITQLYAYKELDNFPAKSHENALAKLTMIAQQLAEKISRTLSVPITSPETPEAVLENILEIAATANEYAKEAEKVYQEVLKVSAQVEEARQSVELSKQSVDESERNVTAMTVQVLEYSDELEAVAENIDSIHVVEANQDAISALAADLQGYPIYEFDGGEITDPNQPMNGVGGVMKICADNIDAIKKVAGSLEDSAALAMLAEDVTELGQTDYLTIVNTGNSEPSNA